MDIKLKNYFFSFFLILVISLSSVTSKALSVGVKYLNQSGGLNYADSSNNYYSLLLSNGYDARVEISQSLGPVLINLRGTQWSYSMTLPTNIPGPTPSSYTTQLSGAGELISFSYSKSGFSPLILASSENIMLIPSVPVSQEFSISTQAVTMAGLGFSVIGTTKKPKMEIRGSLDVRYPVSTINSNGLPLSFKYLTEINAETLFGKGRHWGLTGVLRMEQYSDVFTYYLVNFGFGIILKI